MCITLYKWNNTIDTLGCLASLTQHNCILCRDSYYLQPETGSTNCFNTCPTYYIKDDNDNKCINCKDKNEYRYETDITCTLTSKPDNTYDINTDLFVDEHGLPTVLKYIPTEWGGELSFTENKTAFDIKITEENLTYSLVGNVGDAKTN